MLQPTNAQMPKINPQAGGANAVNINIFNPQAYGNAPEGVQQPPYGYANSLYQMPQGEIYNTQNQTLLPPAQYYLPQLNPQAQGVAQGLQPPFATPVPPMIPYQPQSLYPAIPNGLAPYQQQPLYQLPNGLAPYQQQQPIYQLPSGLVQDKLQSLYQMPQAEIYNTQNQAGVPSVPYYAPQQSPMVQVAQTVQQPVVAPPPNVMPDSIIPAQVQTEQPQATEVKTDEANKPQEAQETENKESEVPSVDTDSLINGLKSDDAKLKSKAINELAKYAQEKPEVALQVVSEPIMQALVDVIKEDTSNLEGPTDKQIEIAEKISKQEKLTPEEEELSNQLSPRDTANKNRIFALYTLAMIQKLQRDELNQYIETQKANGEQPIEGLKLEDLVGYGDVVNTIKNDPRPEVQVAAIQALEHVAEAGDKAKVEEILADSTKSKNETVKAAAQEALSKFEAQ